MPPPHYSPPLKAEVEAMKGHELIREAVRLLPV